MRSVTVLAPAKLNLTLDVTGTRPDGYHTLDMIMQAVSLRERVTLRRSRGLSLSLPGSRVPANEHNTAYKAALAFFHGTGLLAGAAITVEKHVPVRAGMAGGSADAAAVLHGLNQMFRAGLPLEALVELGGAVDVIACASHGVLSGPAVERIEKSVLKEVYFLDTVPPKAGVACDKIKYLSVAHMFAEAIERIYEEVSVSKLFV